MPTESDLMFVQLPDGTIKGPFETRKIVETYRAGRVPNGSRVSSSREGPWQRVADFARVSPEVESPLVVRPVMSAEAAAGGSA